MTKLQLSNVTAHLDISIEHAELQNVLTVCKTKENRVLEVYSSKILYITTGNLTICEWYSEVQGLDHILCDLGVISKRKTSTHHGIENTAPVQ